MGEPLDEWDDKLIEHILQHGDDLSFTKHFWRECNYRPADLTQFRRFALSFEKAYKGESSELIARDVGVPTSTVDS